LLTRVPTRIIVADAVDPRNWGQMGKRMRRIQPQSRIHPRFGPHNKEGNDHTEVVVATRNALSSSSSCSVWRPDTWPGVSSIIVIKAATRPVVIENLLEST
jgi:hypothetical protein